MPAPVGLVQEEEVGQRLSFAKSASCIYIAGFAWSWVQGLAYRSPLRSRANFGVLPLALYLVQLGRALQGRDRCPLNELLLLLCFTQACICACLVRLRKGAYGECDYAIRNASDAGGTHARGCHACLPQHT